MEAKLETVTAHLARVVFVAAVVFSLSVTLLASLTGVMTLLLGTAFGVATAGYAAQVMQARPRTVAIRLDTERVVADAA